MSTSSEDWVPRVLIPLARGGLWPFANPVPSIETALGRQGCTAPVITLRRDRWPTELTRSLAKDGGRGGGGDGGDRWRLAGGAEAWSLVSRRQLSRQGPSFTNLGLGLILQIVMTKFTLSDLSTFKKVMNLYLRNEFLRSCNVRSFLLIAHS